MKFLYCIPFVLFSFLPLTAQTVTTSDTRNHTADQKEQVMTLPTEYRGIQLGMNIDTVKEILKNDAVFGYRGERDVSL